MYPRFNQVLVVDDCRTIRLWLEKNLSSHGYSITSCEDGVEAMKLLHSRSFNYVLTDWDMPRMDGEMLCRNVRTVDSRYIYTMMMTAHTETINVVAGFTAGADDFIVKPLILSELLARMQAGARILEMDSHMSQLANQDPLTGTLNRRTFVGRLSKELEICNRRKKPLSCIMVDLDHFKKLNDAHGHMAGDNALRMVADILHTQFRNSDYVYRYGGEEFCIVLIDTDEDGAFLCAERCRDQIANLDIKDSDQLTASFGVATSRNNTSTPVEMIERADAALLQAKRDGRNRTVRFSSMCDETEIEATDDGVAVNDEVTTNV